MVVIPGALGGICFVIGTLLAWVVTHRSISLMRADPSKPTSLCAILYLFVSARPFFCKDLGLRKASSIQWLSFQHIGLCMTASSHPLPFAPDAIEELILLPCLPARLLCSQCNGCEIHDQEATAPELISNKVKFHSSALV